jgi:hypothetical protein
MDFSISARTLDGDGNTGLHCQTCDTHAKHATRAKNYPSSLCREVGYKHNNTFPSLFLPNTRKKCQKKCDWCRQHDSCVSWRWLEQDIKSVANAAVVVPLPCDQTRNQQKCKKGVTLEQKELNRKT